jgi:methionyl-tRNA formyltransferase
VFAGTAGFAVPSLRALAAAGHDLPLVVAQPDRAGHRGRTAPPAVKQAAQELGLPVAQPEWVRSEQGVSAITAASPEIMVVVAYGQIISPSILALPERGILNVHASLLPRHRGAAPIQYAILAGDEVTGVTIMQMDELLDHGPILAARPTGIGPHEDAAELSARLAEIGAQLLVETLARLDEVVPVEQDHAQATLAPRLERSAGDLSWATSAEDIDRKVRAYQPWPGVTLPFGAGRVKVLRGRPLNQQGEPGSVLAHGRRGVEVAAGTGSYLLEEVQLPGRRPMPAHSLLAANA